MSIVSQSVVVTLLSLLQQGSTSEPVSDYTQYVDPLYVRLPMTEAINF